MLNFREMIVARDRAHVRTLVDAYPLAEVVTASQFFDKVRLLAYVHDDVVRDDYAPLFFAQRVLTEQRTYPLRFAKNFASLYAACFHGVARPRDVLAHLSPEHEKFYALFSLLDHMDDEMTTERLVTNVTALFRAYSLIQTKQLVPPHLLDVARVSLHHLVDLTSLEIEVIKALSRLGLMFDIRFPLDFARRGINTAVDFAASCFERDDALVNIELSFDKIAGTGPLNVLVDHIFTDENIEISPRVCDVHQASSVLAEADHVAQRIAQIFLTTPEAQIAVAVRTMDARAHLFKQSLLRHGITVRDRKGVAIAKSDAGVLLETLLEARLWRLKRRDLVGLINHPLFVHRIVDGHVRSRIVRLVTKLGVDDRFIDDKDGLYRYSSKLSAFLATDEHRDDIANLTTLLDAIDSLMRLLPNDAPPHQFLRALSTMVERAMLPDTTVEALKKALSDMSTSRAWRDDDPALSLNEMMSMLKTELSALTIPSPDVPDMHAVEWLLLPELLGRQFEHVFVVDMAFGRLPNVSAPDVLLDDRERAQLNRIMKKPFLRIFLDDPFEPMPSPPRQALEPFWFACAVASAKSSIHFSTALRDESDQEQAPSEYFLWLREHVTLHDDDALKPPLFGSVQHQRFQQGRADAHGSVPSPYQQALAERRRGFIEGTTADFSFALHSHKIEHAFAGRLGAPPRVALSPTMIEAFAECRLRGWLLRILKLEQKTGDADDIDARVIGELAHATLERFFCDGNEASDTSAVFERVRLLLHDVVQYFAANNFISNPQILICYQEWLVDALTTLIMHMEHERRKIGGTTIFSEVDFGLGNAHRPAVKLTNGTREYLLGGRVDRIDRTEQGFLIIDYKLSSRDALQAKLSPQNLLKGNFQAPIYLRLVAHHVAGDDRTKVAFAFASIRDGELLQALQHDANVSVFDAIFDDNKSESLACEVDKIFAPIQRGEIAATPGEHCTQCDFSFFCRRNEWEDHVS